MTRERGMRGMRWPSCDCSGVPQEKTRPVVVRARMWLFPAAREMILVRWGMGMGVRWRRREGLRVLLLSRAEAVEKPRMPSLACDC